MSAIDRIMRIRDWVALLEAGYRVDGDDQRWLSDVLERAEPLFERGIWPSIYTFRYTPTTVVVQTLATRGPQRVAQVLRESVDESPQAVDLVYRRDVGVNTMSETVFARMPAERANFRRKGLGLVRDSLGVKAFTGTGQGLMLATALMRSSRPSAREQALWPLAASHLAAGLRLRRLASDLSPEAGVVEAIFDGGGHLYDARDEASRPARREQLRKRVRQLDHLRSRAGRSDPEQALAGWEALVDGRWSLVDMFDSDQRRFVVAVRNDPAFPDPRGLTTRERQVAEFAGLGQSSKQISYTLGLSPSAVTNNTASAQAKLGLGSRTELAAFFAPSGLRTKLAELALAGERLLVGAYPLVDERRVRNLTAAEREVLAAILAGSTNQDIAQRRRASAHTVAKQVQSVFRKLGVRSRSELAARLQASPD